MGSETTRYSFAELLSNVVDNRGKTCPVSEEGLPLIATNCVKNDTLYPVFEKVRRIDQETYENWFRGHPEPGDLIFVTKGAPGNVCWTPSPVNFCIAQDMVAIRANSKIIDSKYLFALLRAPSTQASIVNMHVGTMIPHFKKGDFKNLFFDIPTDIVLQKEIGKIYFDFCRKIELNRQINITLESMAQALFRSWFVDFDPVIDNALAAGKPIPYELEAKAQRRAALGDQQQSLPAQIQQLFPSSFVLNEEMGWVPEGWGSLPVYERAKFVNGASFKDSHFSADRSGLPIIKIAEIKNGVSGQTKFTELDFDSRYRMKDGDIVFSWSGNPETSIDTFIWMGGEGWLNQHIFKVCLKSEDDYSFVYTMLKNLKPVFTEIARDKQTTGLGHVTAGDMKKLHIISPPSLVLREFNKLASKFIKRRNSGVRELNSLVLTRDGLLPKLLSGQIRMPEAEQQLSEVM
jgi:type I restriction enzyme S subunit